MDEEPQNEEYDQRQEYSRRIRNAKKAKKAKIKKVKNKIEGKAGKIAGAAIKKWIYVLMLSVVGFIPAVAAIDAYAIVSLFSKKLGKMKIWDWGILVFANFILAAIFIIGFMIFYCVLNPVECGWETAKESVGL
ncbi:hypothetical protein KAI52_04155 [Candidatus Parcubacteria bacterium]|nr:hypothetical protein [Candidatus Parcubacteria bacterium]